MLVPAHGLDACFFNIEFFVPDDGAGSDRGAEPADRLAVLAARRGSSRPPDVRRAVRARVRRGSGVGRQRAERRRHLVRRAGVRGRARRGRSRAARTGSRSSSVPGSCCRSRGRTTRRATGSRSSPSRRRRGRLRFERCRRAGAVASLRAREGQPQPADERAGEAPARPRPTSPPGTRRRPPRAPTRFARRARTGFLAAL